MDRVEELRQQVIEYTNRHGELKESHHYDFAINLTDRVEYFVMGLNPAETSEDRLLHPGKGYFNPYDKPPFSRSSKVWQTRSKNLLGTSDILYGYFFFWSSSDTGPSFEKRFGTILEKSPHLAFCAAMICQIVDLYKPKALIIPGLKLAAVVPPLYKEISHVETRLVEYRIDGDEIVSVDANEKIEHRVDGPLVVKHCRIEHYTDGVRPWLFFAHYGWLSNRKMACVRWYLDLILPLYLT